MILDPHIDYPQDGYHVDFITYHSLKAFIKSTELISDKEIFIASLD